MYINTTSLQTFTESEIRAAFPNVSFAQPFSPPEGYAVLFPVPQPAYNPVTHTVGEGAPMLTDKGHWAQTWHIVELDAQAMAAKQVEATQAKIREIVAAMEALFDTTAQSKRYDNRITCALRAGYPGPFQAEGMAFATWMDNCNATAYQMLAQVQAGTMQMPDTTADALALLPTMVWP